MARPPASSQLTRAAGWTAFGLVITGLLRFGARWISEAFFGIEGLAFVTVAMSIATIAVIPGAIGMSAGVTKLVAERAPEGGGRATARAAVLAGMVAALIAAVGAGIYASSDPSVEALGTSGAAAIAMLTLAFAAYTLGKAILFGFGGSRRYALEESAGIVLFALGAVAAWMTGQVELMAVALVLAYLPVARETIVQPPPSGDQADRRSLLGYSVVGTIGSLAGIGFTAVTPLAAATLGGAAGAALVGAMLAILEPLNLAPRAVGLVILPEISRSEAVNDRPASASSLLTGTGLVAAIALPLCLILLLERDRILGLVFSSDLVGGAALGWFAMAFLVSVVGAPAVTSLAAARLRTATVSMTASLIGFGMAIALWILLGESWGVTAIAFGYFIGSVVQVTIPIGVAWHRFRVRWIGQWIRILAATGVALVLATLQPSFFIDGLVVGVVLVALAPELNGLFRTLRADS